MTKKKLTLGDLIENKEKLLGIKKTTKDLYIETLDAVITIERPDRALVMDTLELSEDKNFDGNPDEYLVYNVMVEPNLKDAELQKIYECKEPTDIVSKIFDMGTVKGIAEQALGMAGFDSKVTAVEELKN